MLLPILVPLPDQKKVVGGRVVRNEGFPIGKCSFEENRIINKVGFVQALSDDASLLALGLLNLIYQH